MDATPVVTCFLRNGTDVLLQRRSDDAESFPGSWAGVSGHVDGDPGEAAVRAIAAETGLEDAVTLARVGEPFVVGTDTRWHVHPFLFDCDRRDTEPNLKGSESEWVPPTVILDRDTVPGLWDAYRRVAPTVDSIRTDTTHGAAFLSIRALEVVRDTAADPDRDDVRTVAEAVFDARPSMAVLANRVARVMHDADGVSDVATVANDAIRRALDADAAAAANTRRVVEDRTVLTLSRSGTVFAALTGGTPARVVVAESRPDREGVDVAERLAADGVDVTLVTDAAIGAKLEDVDVVLVGADAVLPDGRVVNKTGTRLAAVAATDAEVPVYVAASRDKVTPDPHPHLEAGDPAAVYDGDADVAVENPRFDVTPADTVTGYVTEDGVLDVDGVAEVAARHAVHRTWR